jgi:hypothetical protein
MTLKQRKITGTYAAFERRYGPIVTSEADGQITRDWDDPALKDVDIHLIWTIVDCEGKLVLVPGYATVNYFARVLCERPWGDDEEFNTGYIY